LIAEQNQRRIVKTELTKSKVELMKLVDNVSDLADEDLHTQTDFNCAVDKKVAKKLQKFWDESDAKVAKDVTKASDAADKYAAKIVVANAKYVDKCEEVRILQAKLHTLDSVDEGVGDEDDRHESPYTNLDCRQRKQGRPPSVSIPRDMIAPSNIMLHTKKSKEVERLKSEIFAAHAAIDVAVLTTPRTRSHKGKVGGKDLIKKMKDLANKLKKIDVEHADFIK